MSKDASYVNELDDFQGATKIASILRDDNKKGDLRFEYEKKPAKKKTTYAEVVTDKEGNKEITNIFESSDFKRNQERYYKSTDSVIKKGDKASETNYAKNPLALEDINNGKEVEIFELPGTKRDNLRHYKEIHGYAPRKNFQANDEKIPEIIEHDRKKNIEEYKKDRLNKKGVK